LSEAELVQASRVAIQTGSRSFAAAAALFPPEIREDAEALYAWCRHCDDVIDGQVMGHGMSAQAPEAARARLAELQARTRAALAGEPQDDAAFAAFQAVARRRAISRDYAQALLEGFAMDVSGRTYRTLEDTLEYCWHVAGVVGAMMALVMGVAPDDLDTLRRAQDLGLALQLTNIARDVVEDARNGRVYLPGAWLEQAGISADAVAVADPAARAAVAAVTRRLLASAEPYYASSLQGLAALYWRSAWAVAAARGVYRRIGVEVAARGPRAWDRRVSVSGPMKAALTLHAGVLTLVSRFQPAFPPRAPLWSKI
jgi:phytoene synthase